MLYEHINHNLCICGDTVWNAPDGAPRILEVINVKSQRLRHIIGVLTGQARPDSILSMDIRGSDWGILGNRGLQKIYPIFFWFFVRSDWGILGNRGLQNGLL
jgi:hypothetical protein